MPDDDDDASFGGAYQDGHWIWDDTSGCLVFISDLPPEQIDAITVSVKVPTSVEFKEIDLIEQMRFRKRYQRKVKQGQLDVISVQDIKDLAIYTAPLSLLSPALINMLHLSTTERFIRALILYCQYYLQTAEEMSRRMAELETKVRTPVCETLEEEYRENLCDLRTMVAKEYCTMIIGGDDTKKFHHMGAQKKRRSLSDKDARLFETLLRMCIQIVWLALARRSFNQLELEVNRIFKSEIFNNVEHTLKTGYLANMSAIERSVLLGHCVRRSDQKLNVRSPLGNEVFCHRPVDFRMMGLGVIRYDNLTPRLRYLLLAVAAPEEDFQSLGITVGILGLPRAYFDTVLNVLPTVVEANKIKSKSSLGSSSGRVTGGVSASASTSGKSVGSVKKDKASEKKYIYRDIKLPPKELEEPPFPSSFPEKSALARPCNNKQRRLWINRLDRMLHAPLHMRKSVID